MAMTRNQRDWLNIAAFLAGAALLYFACYLALYPESRSGRMNACRDHGTENYCLDVVD